VHSPKRVADPLDAKVAAIGQVAGDDRPRNPIH
jgi:hypothetical protein